DLSEIREVRVQASPIGGAQLAAQRVEAALHVSPGQRRSSSSIEGDSGSAEPPPHAAVTSRIAPRPGSRERRGPRSSGDRRPLRIAPCSFLEWEREPREAAHVTKVLFPPGWSGAGVLISTSSLPLRRRPEIRLG